MVSAREIVQHIMNPDPAYYTGRGNMRIDLDSYKLERIWEEIGQKIGRPAADAFVEMVRDLTKRGDVSATTFLSALDDLAYNRWNYSGDTPSTETAIISAIEGSDYPGHIKDSLKTVSFGPQSPSTVSASDITGDFLRQRPKSSKAPDAAKVTAVGPMTQRLRDALETFRKSDSNGQRPVGS